nr:NADH dehydrogenase subunit 6 [Nogodinidae sp.]
MKLITKMMMINSIMFPLMKHPMSMGMILIMQTILISMMISFYSMSSWFSYILFITIIGGMMVMFMYMASIASNEMFKLNNNKVMITVIIITMMMMMNKTDDQLTNEMNQKTMNKIMNMEKEEIKSISKFFNMNKMMITIIMMMILLTTMISITTISSTFEGPLKKTYV